MLAETWMPNTALRRAAIELAVILGQLHDMLCSHVSRATSRDCTRLEAPPRQYLPRRRDRRSLLLFLKPISV